jgi:putative Mg2+ transporter-C (MgtC) family protein
LETTVSITTIQFTLRLFTALLLGAAVGLERQWRQRMAGTRTNALVAAGASAFVMAGSLLVDDPSATGRVVSYVVSGVGFLGAGVIFKDSANIRGLNTAATIWCSAAVGVLAGLGAFHLSLMLAIAVLFANTALRPLAYRLHPALPETGTVETTYELNMVCRASDEAHIRTLLLTTISQYTVGLQSIRSEDIEGSDRTTVRAEVITSGPKHDTVEQIVTRLSIEPGIAAVSWSVVPTMTE